MGCDQCYSDFRTWKHVGNNASFENASRHNNVLHETNVDNENRNNIPDEVSELSVPEIDFDPQLHTHHMVTGETTQTNHFPEFITGRILTPCNPPSHQHQNLSTQVSRDNSLPRVEQTPRNLKSDANNSINRQADAIAGNATQQRPQAATMLKPVSTNTLILHGKKRKNWNFWKPLSHNAQIATRDDLSYEN